jgi:hypothetical protein
LFGINDGLNSFRESSAAKNLMYPFSTLGVAATPEFWRTTLAYIEFLWTCSAPAYSSALKSAIALNITEITYSDISEEAELSLSAKNTIERDLTAILGGTKELMDIGCDLMCYGNAFRSVYLPFTRNIICPTCKSQYGLKYALDNPENFNFRYKPMTVQVGKGGALPTMGDCSCPDCGYRGVMYIKDLMSSSKQEISIVKWRPQDILIESGAFDGKTCIYHLRPNSEMKTNVREGRTLTLLTYPMELLYTCTRDNITFQFNADEVFHLRDTTLSGVLTYGWGIPRALSHFQLVWQLACLYKINEAIAIDYSVPKRLITPAPRSGASDGVTADPAGTIDLLPYLHQAKQMWTTNDPGQVQFLPFPVQYQLLGGEAKNLVPDELLQLAEDALLSALDVPAELYRNTLSVEGAPLALALFENKWRWFGNGLELFLAWLSDKLGPKLGWSPVKLELLPLKISADVARATLDVQLAAQGTISWGTALKSLGHNYLEEQKRVIDEQKVIMDVQQEAEEQGALQGMLPNITMSQNPAAAGQPPPPPEAMGGGMGGMPPMGGGMEGIEGGMPSPAAQGMMGCLNAGMEMSDYEKLSPADWLSLAQNFAQQVKQSEMSGGRQQALAALRKQLPDPLYSAVKRELERMDDAQRNDGYNLLNEQGGGQV